MKRTLLAIFCVCVALLALGPRIALGADIFKCKQPNGVIAYQQAPCTKTEQQIAHSHFQRQPDAPIYSQPRPGSSARLPEGYVTNTSGQAAHGFSTNESAGSINTPLGCAGIGCSAHQRGDVTTRECVAPDGRHYYTTNACRTRFNVVDSQSRDWQNDTVEGVPGAVMVGPDRALDPSTGRYIQLQHSPVLQRAQDPGQRIDPDAACRQARLDAKLHPHDTAAAKRAGIVCSKGRGLWDQPPPDRGGR